ncbi:DUF4097 family beta strand repeat-containing protein [Streptomyces sp. VRA16 Mangrove soil]|uniref:DUF4097 family beta strand repeat-containing protein n=1 Tax=Streptomyces sp. VRA16 Mangrove soil TaxID=2817434 RepID=UPI001A9E9ED7|nr:DUF4097 family beta strand repeat-containing protein [Streptomyces sp. VRA16 Mangrove soil]MBO1330152.1 DUF4097 family beta strand repeat protein [Streptomyces sp. VRA16 Mangrove soil]
MQKFDAPAPITAVLDIPAGRIQLIAAHRTDAVVEVLPAHPAKSRDAKAAEQATVEFRDGVLRIATAAPRHALIGPSGAVEVTVRLPVGSRVEAKAAATDLRGVGRLGDVVFESAQSEVKLDEAAGVRIGLQGGDVRIGRLDGDSEISTRKGDLTVTEAVRGTLTLRTEHGDIHVGAAHGVCATLDAGTSYGRVHNALHNAEGEGAGLAVHATTSYGDITARSL